MCSIWATQYKLNETQEDLEILMEKEIRYKGLMEYCKYLREETGEPYYLSHSCEIIK